MSRERFEQLVERYTLAAAGLRRYDTGLATEAAAVREMSDSSAGCRNRVRSHGHNPPCCSFSADCSQSSLRDCMELAERENSVVLAAWPIEVSALEESAWSAIAVAAHSLVGCRRSAWWEESEERTGRLQIEQESYSRWCRAESSSAQSQCLCQHADSGYSRYSAPGRHWRHIPDHRRQQSWIAGAGHTGPGAAGSATVAAAAAAAVAADTAGIGRTATSPLMRADDIKIVGSAQMLEEHQ